MKSKNKRRPLRTIKMLKQVQHDAMRELVIPNLFRNLSGGFYHPLLLRVARSMRAYREGVQHSFTIY